MPDTQRALEVYIQPPRPDLLDGAAVAVIDILRATTVHTALLAHGAEAVYPVAQWADAQRLRGALPGSRLIGEVDSLPGPGAEFGNSPTEFASLDVTGWTTIHVTGNGTRALAAAAHAPFVISACLRNLSACAAALCNDAVRRVAPIAIVCSGDHNGSTASLEDTVAAGAYVEELTRLAPALRLDNGAMIALKLWQAYDGPALERHVEWVHRELLGGSPSRVLDLGCGPGLYTDRLAALGHECVAGPIGRSGRPARIAAWT